MLYGQVSIDPEVMSGTPVFTGTRVPIQNLFDYKRAVKIFQNSSMIFLR